jgi:hypothetical protein
VAASFVATRQFCYAADSVACYYPYDKIYTSQGNFMQTFIEANWLTLLSIVIGALVAFVFYRLQEKDFASASQERKKRAKSELLDMVESYIINKQELSEHAVENLIVASERDHVVSLRGRCSSVSLLQDVALRLQRSRHLDIAQKSEYSSKIEELIREIQEEAKTSASDQFSKEFRQNLSAIESLIPHERREEARKPVDALSLLIVRRRDLTAKKSDDNSLFPITGALVAGIASILATSSIGSKFFADGLTPIGSTVFTELFPFLGIALLVLLAIPLLLIAFRIHSRGREMRRLDVGSASGA